MEIKATYTYMDTRKMAEKASYKLFIKIVTVVHLNVASACTCKKNGLLSMKKCKDIVSWIRMSV